MKTHFRINVATIVLMGTLLVVPTTSFSADFETVNGWNGHLFPSYIVATATLKVAIKEDDDDDEEVLGDRQGLLGISIEADEDDQELIVTITCDALMKSSTISCTLPKAGETYVVKPKIKYNYDQLAKRTQSGPVTVTYKVESGDDDAEEKTEILTVRSINDCPYSVCKDGTWTSTRFMFAAYVNEQHPFVDKILREALDTEIVDSFTGYQAKDAAEVYRQAYSLWHALSKRGVRYSSITKTAATSDMVGSQHIRLVDESINNGQANCVDGSTLLASLLRKINIEPMLVHVPGHCYLAFYLDADEKELTALETTMIGSEIEGDAIEVSGLEEVAGEDFQEENSWKTFSAAIAHGTANLKKFSKEFKDASNQNYKLISIAAARKAGVLPISFQSKAKMIEAPKDAEEE